MPNQYDEKILEFFVTQDPYCNYNFWKTQASFTKMELFEKKIFQKTLLHELFSTFLF